MTVVRNKTNHTNMSPGGKLRQVYDSTMVSRGPFQLTFIVGKTLAYTNIKFTNEKGEVVARGSHTK